MATPPVACTVWSLIPPESFLSTPYPVELAPIVLPKVWGGRRFETLGIHLPPEAAMGEAWMVADLPTTSASGAGGQAVLSPIVNGAFAGDSLQLARRQWFGSAVAPFPVLVKLLDAREHLSVQVHPSPAYAARHADAHLKTECWFVLDAEPGAELLLGVQTGVTIGDVRDGALAGTLPSLMQRVPAEVGACYLLPSGMIHALGAGVLVAEVQTASDTTYRLYDWTAEYARPERQLHLDVSLEACALSLRPVVARRPHDAWRGVVADTEFFTVMEVALEPGREVSLSELSDGTGDVVILGLDGSIEMTSRDHSWEKATASPTHAVLVPEACRAGAAITTSAAARILAVHVPV